MIHPANLFLFDSSLSLDLIENNKKTLSSLPELMTLLQQIYNCLWGSAETLMGVFSVSRGWMMTMMMATTMGESWMLLITAHLFNQLVQRETHSLTNRGKERIPTGKKRWHATVRREEKNDSSHNRTDLEISLHPVKCDQKKHTDQHKQSITFPLVTFVLSTWTGNLKKKNPSQCSPHCLAYR